MEIGRRVFSAAFSTASLSAAFLVALSCGKAEAPVTPDSVPLGPGPDAVWEDVTDFLSRTETMVVEQHEQTFMRLYWPDGKLIPLRRGSEWQLFWGEATDALTTAATPYPEDHIAALTDGSKVWGKEFSRIDGFNDGGSWFIGIFPLDEKGHYVGFFHAESHWPGDGTAYKSIGVAYSDDFGSTWRDPQPIIMDDTAKPAEPAWTGLGDGCVIWDSVSSRYICYYQAKTSVGAKSLCMAASTARDGASGTWKKWDGSDFTIDAYDPVTGLGGRNVALANLRRVAGANPSVMWNTFMNRWVMVYASWQKSVYMSFSDDALAWERPVKILGDGATAWYPNLIGADGDLTGGEFVKLYWSHAQNDLGQRDLAYCWIKFKKQIQ